MNQFQKDTAIQPQEDHVYAVKVSDQWSVNGVPNGGYLMAMMAKAALEDSERNAPVSITANFLKRTDPGDASISNEVMVQSKQFDRRSVSLNQGGKETVRAMITLVTDYEDDAETRYEAVPPAVKPRSECQLNMALPKYTIFNNTVSLMEHDSFGWMAGKPKDLSEHRGWFRLKEEQPWDAMSVLLASDALPPPILASHGMVAWVPTIEMSVQIRRIPTTRWLKCIFKSKYITGGLVEEDGEIWDEDGNLIAISRQLAQFRKGPESKVQNMVLKAASKVMAVDRKRRKK